MGYDPLFGLVGNRPAGHTDWQWCDYSLPADAVRREALAHHDADCCEPDYEPLDWAIRLDDGSVITVHNG